MLSQKIGYYEFIIASLMMTMASYTIMKYGQLSILVLSFLAILTASYLVFAFIFIVNFREKKQHNRFAVWKNVFFALFIVALAGSIFSDAAMTSGMIGGILWWFVNLGTQFVFFLMVFFAFFFSAFFIKVAKNNLLGMLFAALGIVILWAFFASGNISSGFRVNDETLLSMASVNASLNGINLYTFSLFNYFYSLSGKIGLTLLTTNNIASVMDYPALYFLSYLPFYAISRIFPWLGASLSLYAVVSLVILMSIIVLSVKKEYLTRPIFGLLLVLAIGISDIASITTYLMLALLILAYIKIDKEYVGVIIGIGAAIQQEIWIPLLLLLVYSANNYGYRKGARDMFIAAVVFLLINGYFILQNPIAFVHQVLLPASGPIFPNSWAAFGYPILISYGVPLSYFAILSGLVLLGLIVIFVYFNEKRLIGLFSLIPLLFLQRGIFVYYAFFILFMVLTLFLEEGAPRKPILKKKFLPSRWKFATALGMVLFVILITLYLEHQVYLQNFNLTILNQSLGFSSALNYSLYHAAIRFDKLGNSTEYVYVITYADGGTFQYGVFNSSIIDNPVVCPANDYRCLFNVNRIVLSDTNSALGNYRLDLHFENIVVAPQNFTNGFAVNESNITRIFHPDIVDVGIYNSQYYYSSMPYYNSSMANSLNSGS